MGTVEEEIEGKPSRGQKLAVEPRFRHVELSERFLDQPDRATRKEVKEGKKE
jgi:hypothetical protein